MSSSSDQTRCFGMDEVVPLDHTASPAMPTSSPPTLPATLHMKRTNPKHLSLSLSFPPPISTSLTTAISTPTTASASGSKDNTPYTPGPPRTPALAMTLGRASLRKPSLLSLITQPPDGSPGIPPTPFTTRPGFQTTDSGSEEVMDDVGHTPCGKGLRNTSRIGTIDENASFAVSDTRRSTSLNSSSSTSCRSSTSTSPSTSPPNPTSSTFCIPPRPAEPYAGGPVEILPGVFLGAENSVSRWYWARGSKRARVMNVAQEVEDPFARTKPAGRGHEKVKLANYAAEGQRPEVEYCHLRWSHGEGGLAELPEGARLGEMLGQDKGRSSTSRWGFWEAIRWLEEGRRNGIPLLIHCQCGVSRSATLAIAYIMSLAASGLFPNLLGHLSNMQDAYEYIKSRSPCIGPNVSLVFQLVEFARNLTTLLSEHPEEVDTRFPRIADMGLSEADWAAKRRAFDDDGDMRSPVSPEEAGDEARMLDEVMAARRHRRE